MTARRCGTDARHGTACLFATGERMGVRSQFWMLVIGMAIHAVVFVSNVIQMSHNGLDWEGVGCMVFSSNAVIVFCWMLEWRRRP